MKFLTQASADFIPKPSLETYKKIIEKPKIEHNIVYLLKILREI